MITFKCPQCGSQLNIDENVTNEVKCPHCDYVATLEKDAREQYEQLSNKKDNLGRELKTICAAYAEKGEKGNAAAIRTKVESFDRNFPRYQMDTWKSFILEAAGAAEVKKDRELQTYLKNHAKEFDLVLGLKEEGLFSALLQAYPKVGTNNDWDELIKQTQGNKGKFAVLCDNLINYIIKTRDKAFAMDIFNLLSAQEEEWAESGRIYLRALLSSEEVASEVFTKSAFNGRTKKFIKKLSAYCKKYLSGGNEITLEETKVWSNYLAARKSQKRRNIIISLIMAVIIAGSGAGTFAYLDAPNKSTVKIEVDRVIEVIYGEKPDLSGYKIVYDKNSGAHVEKDITVKMLKGYDPEKLGEQSGIIISFGGVKETVTVIVKKAQLAAPVLRKSGNYVSWDIVPNSETYTVFVNRTAVSVSMTDTTYDLSKLTQYGELSATVRAETSSEKFDNSAESSPLVVTKLKNPENIKYEKGVLSWASVEGATLYEIEVNGGAAVRVEAPSSSYAVALNQGENRIKITAKGAGEEVHGVSAMTLNYTKLNEISSLSYSGDEIKWVADVNATSFDIYVDGKLWMTFSKNSFDTAEDSDFAKFVAENGGTLETIHTIGIVCKSSKLGVESSDVKQVKVHIGNKPKREGDSLIWNTVGTSARYTASCNGVELQFDQPSISISELINAKILKDGDNVITFKAYDGGDIILETVTLKKHAAPKISVSNGAWVGTEEGLVYTFDANSVETLPDVATLTAGVVHTVTAQKVKSSPTAFEVDSEPVEITIFKLVTPQIKVVGGELDCINYDYDTSKFDLSLSISDNNGFVGTTLDSIKAAGSYTVKATLKAKSDVAQEYDLIISSEASQEITLTKLEAPTVRYEENDTAVSSSMSNTGDYTIKFYYVDNNGNEQELVGGLISNLPKGMIEVYARAIPAPDSVNVLASEPTPKAGRAQVFNMKLEFSITMDSKVSLFAVFKNCEEISELSFDYDIRYFDSQKNQIGVWSTPTPVTVKKANQNDAFISRPINFAEPVRYEIDLSQVYYVQIVIKLQSTSGGQTLESKIVAIPR